MRKHLAFFVALLGFAPMAYAQPSVSIQVVPMDVFYAADFDPINPQNSALLFTVTVMNDDQGRDLFLEVVVSGEQYGLLGSARKSLTGVPAGAVSLFTNREVDTIDIAAAGDALVDQATQTGVFPPDTYTYAVRLEDGAGNILDEDEGTNTTTNPLSELELISPGVPFDEAVDLETGTTPLFQWFGQGTFSLAVYPVFPGQTAAEDVVQNRPVYEAEALETGTLLYPAFAEELTPGETYVWQVTARIAASAGHQEQVSPAFKFRVRPADGETKLEEGTATVVDVEVMPPTANVVVGNAVTFQAFAYDAEGGQVDAAPRWRVIPAEAGTIDENGLFIAGSRPMAAAVVADYGTAQSFATTTVRWASGGVRMRALIMKVFGLPGAPANE